MNILLCQSLDQDEEAGYSEPRGNRGKKRKTYQKTKQEKQLLWDGWPWRDKKFQDQPSTRSFVLARISFTYGPLRLDGGNFSAYRSTLFKYSNETFASTCYIYGILPVYERPPPFPSDVPVLRDSPRFFFFSIPTSLEKFPSWNCFSLPRGSTVCQRDRVVTRVWLH